MNDDQIPNAQIDQLIATVEDLKEQLQQSQSERDLLAVMLIEAENARKRSEAGVSPKIERLHAAGEFEHDAATIPSNRKMSISHLLKLISELSPEDQMELKRCLSK